MHYCSTLQIVKAFYSLYFGVQYQWLFRNYGITINNKKIPEDILVYIDISPIKHEALKKSVCLKMLKHIPLLFYF